MSLWVSLSESELLLLEEDAEDDASSSPARRSDNTSDAVLISMSESELLLVDDPDEEVSSLSVSLSDESDEDVSESLDILYVERRVSFTLELDISLRPQRKKNSFEDFA